MYVIIVYDVIDNSNNINKICKRYLNWVQNSVFEGEITENKLKILKKLIKEKSKNIDSILIYTTTNKNNIQKEFIGYEKNEISNFI